MYANYGLGTTRTPEVVDTVTAVPAVLTVMGGAVPDCKVWQQPDWREEKYVCRTTPISLLAAPGRMIGGALAPIFKDQDRYQLDMIGHIATALILIGGTVYLFNSSKR